MKNTLEDFKTKTKRCEDVFEADRVCLVWLRLSCRECGEVGEYAAKMLSIVEEMLSK